ncbi:p-hydroxycinnamoyl CoA hydratase/lyase [Saccharopolyspora flava]|uniref:Vanillin synthase/trans-feruloyl-CoA hydratase n=1 Tax=Saccharopolyspora flava TaxID=95161 RepID=A0A1I6U6T1_9PSEU|nr:p-hydroxycinnamoyl CoA hydratase/lyase [Saccharopolyspora flava]SFS97156.1 vanillin synthase/trans-feruloyl-CoA hydratase [Saccharopolyspora flava]
MSTSEKPWGNTVLVDFEDGIAWVTLNRPEKRNAMNPALNDEMVATLDALEADPRCRVLVLTGAGEAWSAGMDLKEYFREVDEADDPSVQIRVRRASAEWQWKRLANWSKPTIAMVNGWCFGGAFTPLVACDLAIADENARFGLSEINWGIPPGGVVTRALAATVPQRDALYYIMTGELFDGRQASEMRLVNEAVPAERLRERTRELAAKLAATNPVVLRAAKVGYKVARDMPWEQAEDYLYAKFEQSQFLDHTNGRQKGMSQFLDDKTYKPGLSAYRD